VRVTRDGALALMHDAKVDRTTDGEGRFSDMTLDELRRLDAGVRKDARFAGTRIPIFDETLAIIYGKTEKDVRAIFQRLGLVDEYLRSIGKERQYELVEGSECNGPKSLDSFWRFLGGSLLQLSLSPSEFELNWGQIP
jgi:hypothetical protein